MFQACFNHSVRRFALNTGVMVLAVISMETYVNCQPNGGPAAAALTISRYALSPYMRAHVQVIGDRMVKAGNERVTLSGLLSGSTPAPVTVTYEISGKIRIDGAGRSIGFDGANTWNRNSAFSDSDFELIEALLNDSAEYLFAGQAHHLATRFYGPAFRFDDGKAKNYTGPYYDVFEVVDSAPGSKIPQVRIYCFNSRTYVLERVQQDTKRSGKKVRIETVLGGWKYFGTQQFPTSIARTQDGQQIVALTISSAATGPAVADGFLNAPKP